MNRTPRRKWEIYLEILRAIENMRPNNLKKSNISFEIKLQYKKGLIYMNRLKKMKAITLDPEIKITQKGIIMKYRLEKISKQFEHLQRQFKGF